MAFKGGFLLKPTQTGVENLGALYLNGVKAIEDKKKKIKEEDDALLKESKSAVNIPTTGVANYDTMMAKYGMSVQQGIQDLYGKLQRGEISRDDYRLALVGSKTSSELMSKYPEIIAKQHADINKGIEEGKLSDINREIHAGRFKDINGSPNNRIRNVEAFFENGRSFITESYSVDSPDGEDEIKSRTIDITSLADPNKILYNLFDLQKEIENFTKTLNEEGVIEVKSQTQPDGTVVRQVIKDPSKSTVVANNINRRINLVDQNSLVDVLYKLGARAEHFSDFKRPTKEDLGNRLGSKTSIDKDGIGISIEPEDLVLDVSTNGKVNLTPKQLDIARGVVRASMYGSLGVDTQVSIERELEVEEKIDVNKMPLQKSSYTRESLLSAAENLQKQYNETIGSTSEVLANTDLGSILGKSTTQTSSLLLPASVSSKLKKVGIKSNSFLNQEIENISSIVGIYDPDTGYEIVFVGESRLGESETEKRDGSLTSTSKVYKRSGEAVSAFATEDQARRLYLELYENEDFREKAEKVGAGKDVKDVKEAFYLISERYSLVPL